MEGTLIAANSGHATEGEADVVAAEAEGVGKHSAQFELTGLVGHDIQITVGIGIAVVDGGRDDAVLQSQNTGHCFNAARTTQEVTGHRLGRTDCNVQGPGSEGAVDGRGFVLVVGRGTGAMGVDVVDAVVTDLAVLKGEANGGGAGITIEQRDGQTAGLTIGG